MVARAGQTTVEIRRTVLALLLFQAARSSLDATVPIVRKKMQDSIRV